MVEYRIKAVVLLTHSVSLMRAIEQDGMVTKGRRGCDAVWLRGVGKCHCNNPLSRAHGVVGYHARLASFVAFARGVGFNSQCVQFFFLCLFR